MVSTSPPSCSSRPEQAPTGSAPLIEHYKGQKRGWSVQICDKGSDRCHPDRAQPHDSKVFHDAVWELEVLCHRSGHQQADSLDVLRHHMPGPMVHRRQCAVHGVCEYVIDWSINAICRIDGTNCRTGGAPHGLSERCWLPVDGVGRPVFLAQQRVARRRGRAVVT